MKKNLLLVLVVLLISAVLGALHAGGAPIGALIGILVLILTALFILAPR